MKEKLFLFFLFIFLFFYSSFCFFLSFYFLFLAKECGYLTTCAWYKEKRIDLKKSSSIHLFDCYKELSSAKKTMIKKFQINENEIEEKKIYFEILKKYFAVILNEMESLKIRNYSYKQTNLELETLENNKVLKYYSYLLIQLHNKLSDINYLRDAFHEVLSEFKEDSLKNIQFYEKINHLVDKKVIKDNNYVPGLLFSEIIKLFSSPQQKDQEKGLILLNGISKFFIIFIFYYFSFFYFLRSTFSSS
jgi:hypothetical protein